MINCFHTELEWYAFLNLEKVNDDYQFPDQQTLLQKVYMMDVLHL